MDRMSRMLFVRHAETDLAGTFCGRTDPPVNERGQEQIAALVSSLAGAEIHAVYTSDLRRALTTASALAQHCACPVIATDQLREIYFGEWEGLTWEQIERRDADYARRWTDDFPKLAPPGGETYENFEERVLEEIELIDEMSGETEVAVVTHAGVMRVVLQKICGTPAEEAWADTSQYCSTFVCDPANCLKHRRLLSKKRS